MHRYLAEFDFRYNTREKLGFNDANGPPSPSKEKKGSGYLPPTLTAPDYSAAAKRFLRWRRKTRWGPKPKKPKVIRRWCK